MSSAVERYFRHYPERTSRLRARLFRRGEEERMRVVRTWLPDTTGLDILDAGCGDGEFLSRLLHGRPARLRLEDCVRKWTEMARERHQDTADHVEAVSTDVRTSPDRARYDAVLAFGLFDYEVDWPGMLTCLLSRSRRWLIADFPKSGTCRSRARSVWLRAHGVVYHSTRRAPLESLLRPAAAAVDIEELPLQWVARLEITPPA
ncbi:MAG: methyltransferase domain-containing protein [Candidatus Zixiibacteriota bacterium]